ncbi:beta-class carbonic anhydrase [Bacillus taeanensis]|uniref:carbonic anhydrase n=1 Tax=Bacillus taeanensis TaxID=273032 RepID=A0A366XNB3_9BACI|nr:carbonic anhydrase [Bacillus taeanensis]RBW67397.1 carbonic anhydrase [Bacillus taeanensis]
MTLLDQILEHNEQFVAKKEYENYQTTKFPDKKLVVLSCMDTRLVELLPRAMNFSNGDIKHVKNAGAIVSHPFGSIMRSILVAIYALKADEVCVVGHHDCGMGSINPSAILDEAINRGVSEEIIATMEHSGINLHDWLKGFNSVEESVQNSVEMIKNHPLLPSGISVHGLVIDPKTGRLDKVVEGY